MGNLMITYGEEEAAHCDLHGDYVFKKAYMNGNYMEALTKKCPQCHSIREAEREKRDQIKRQKELVEHYTREGIEPIFIDCTFDGFLTDTEELRKNKEAVKRLVRGEVNTILMVGNNGTGKTHLAIAALKEIGGHIYTMYEITNTIRKTYMSEATRNEIDIVNELLSNRLLIIDELGRTKGSEAETRWLSYIIDKRYARNMPLIIITNKHTMKDCTRRGCPDCLENYISEDIMSRLAANGLLLRFSGADYRKKKG